MDKQEATSQPSEPKPEIRSLRELIDLVTGRSLKHDYPVEDAGLAEQLPYPFFAIVGQFEMKLALLLSLINPAIGGVLLIGPRGTGKTTAVRSLLDLLPDVERSACFYGCLPQDIESGGMDAVCPDCAKKYAEGLPLTVTEPSRLVELPLNARLEDVVGGLDERAVLHERFRLRRGILAHADQNLLYVDEVNLLANEIVDSILDASAQGSYTVRRGPVSATYRSRYTLIGTMNPEEGNLRSQILDRFGLRVIVRGLDDQNDRLEAYHRVQSYRRNPHRFLSEFAETTTAGREEIQSARKVLPDVRIPDEIANYGIGLIKNLEIDSLRAEITLFEAARAYAAADGRIEITLEDMRQVAPISLRLRNSQFMADYFKEQSQEEEKLKTMLASDPK